eukprot:ctg_351.g173
MATSVHERVHHELDTTATPQAARESLKRAAEAVAQSTYDGRLDWSQYRLGDADLTALIAESVQLGHGAGDVDAGVRVPGTVAAGVQPAEPPIAGVAASGVAAAGRGVQREPGAPARRHLRGPATAARAARRLQPVATLARVVVRCGSRLRLQPGTPGGVRQPPGGTARLHRQPAASARAQPRSQPTADAAAALGRTAGAASATAV